MTILTDDPEKLVPLFNAVSKQLTGLNNGEVLLLLLCLLTKLFFNADPKVRDFLIDASIRALCEVSAMSPEELAAHGAAFRALRKAAQL